MKSAEQRAENSHASDQRNYEIKDASLGNCTAHNSFRIAVLVYDNWKLTAGVMLAAMKNSLYPGVATPRASYPFLVFQKSEIS